MKRYADKILNFKGANPFSDSQARNFSDTKVSKEFYPISNFWSLFNDQHEILLGTRGCGKTFLLKMMRYSMLKKINNPQAKELVKKKEYIGLYVPMHLEFITLFNDSSLPKNMQISLFQIAFNCLLAQSMLIEIEALLDDIEDELEKFKKVAKMVKVIDELWFNIENSDIYELSSLRNKVDKVFYNLDWKNPNLESVPTVFKRQICSSLSSVKSSITQVFMWEEEPTWIICIDEAEFLNETLQKCINSLFRSDTNRIALKVATLPFYHTTLKTIDENISVVNGNDFSYKVVDMDYASKDYIDLTNALCRHRLGTRFNQDSECPTLENFLGIVGNDAQIDYFRNEIGEDKSKREYIEKDIIENFPNTRKKNANTYIEKRKTIYDKFAPIYFTRKMYLLSKKGNSKPGWYAGASVIRKVSQGNPRLFIQLMNKLFEVARETELTEKKQSQAVLDFSSDLCKSTKALENQGPIVDKELSKIAEFLKLRTHDGPMVTVGCAFKLKYKCDDEIQKNKTWIQLAIAYSRLIVDDDVKINGITDNTKYILSYAYAVSFWLVLRNDSPQKISINWDGNNKYRVENKDVDSYQLSLFEEGSQWLG